MAFVTMYKRRELATLATGEAYWNPTPEAWLLHLMITYATWSTVK